jgi:hypothetical protein
MLRVVGVSLAGNSAPNQGTRASSGAGVLPLAGTPLLPAASGVPGLRRLEVVQTASPLSESRAGLGGGGGGVAGASAPAKGGHPFASPSPGALLPLWAGRTAAAPAAAAWAAAPMTAGKPGGAATAWPVTAAASGGGEPAAEALAPPPPRAAGAQGGLRTVSLSGGGGGGGNSSGGGVGHLSSTALPRPVTSPSSAPPSWSMPSPAAAAAVPAPFATPPPQYHRQQLREEGWEPPFRGVRLVSPPAGSAPSSSATPPPPRYEAFVTDDGGNDLGFPVGSHYATAAAAARGHDHAVVCFSGPAACGAAPPGRLNFPAESLVPHPAASATPASSSSSSSVQAYVDPTTARGVVLPRVDSLHEGLRRARALTGAGLAAVAHGSGSSAGGAPSGSSAPPPSGLSDAFCSRCGKLPAADGDDHDGGGGESSGGGSRAQLAAQHPLLTCGFCGRSFHAAPPGAGGCSDLPPGVPARLRPGDVYACCFCAARGQLARLLQPAALSAVSASAPPAPREEGGGRLEDCGGAGSSGGAGGSRNAMALRRPSSQSVAHQPPSPAAPLAGRRRASGGAQAAASTAAEPATQAGVSRGSRPHGKTSRYTGVSKKAGDTSARPWMVRWTGHRHDCYCGNGNVDRPTISEKHAVAAHIYPPKCRVYTHPISMSPGADPSWQLQVPGHLCHGGAGGGGARRGGAALPRP